MDMKKLSAGKLRAIGYDSRERLLRVELEGGIKIDYAGVSEDVWKRLSGASSGAAWSYYRDHIEEEFVGQRSANHSTTQATTARAALDALFSTDQRAKDEGEH